VIFTPDWVEAIGTWVGGLGTVGALWAAIRALNNERAARAEEIRRLRDEEIIRHRTQARSIVLHDAKVDDRSAERDSSQVRAERVYRVTLGKNSEHAINSIAASIRAHEYGEPSIPGFPQWIPVLRAGESILLEWPVFPRTGPEDGLPELTSATKYSVGLMFSDVHGLVWETSSGRLATLADRQNVRPPAQTDSSLKRQGLGRRLRAAAKALRGS